MSSAPTPSITAAQLAIPRLGPGTITSPLRQLLTEAGCESCFVEEPARVLFDLREDMMRRHVDAGTPVPATERAGPRAQIFFDPATTHAAIVTCGGLCPGINDVIRGLVMTLFYRYGVHTITGIRYGYEGCVPGSPHDTIALTPELVSHIHTWGGSMLGTSRGGQDAAAIVQFLQARKMHILFVIGGDGTLRGAVDIAQAAERAAWPLSVVGIPKTVDNDIHYIDYSFGFETAFSEAVQAISIAHTEALGAPNGIGLVKLMGRHSGFIACYAALAVNDVNVVLIPEIPFALDGAQGLLAALRARLERRRHAVLVVAEGAGQEHLPPPCATDASGNVRLQDIGLFLKARINDYFRTIDMRVNLKYIDPSYTIRGVPSSPRDSVYCSRLAQHAVHAAMSGRTQLVIGRRHNQYVHLPMALLAQGRKQVDSSGDLWLAVLEATGQPPEFRADG